MEEKWMYSLWGAAAGVAALAVVGFTWGGWTTGSNAEAMALKRSQAAVVAVLNFRSASRGSRPMQMLL